MLLYDRIMERGHRLFRAAGAQGMSAKDVEFLERLCVATVYELTNVVPLLPDWEQGRTQTIPKRPPHRIVWAEWDWREEGEGGWTEWTLGALVLHLTEEDRRRDYFQWRAESPLPAPAPENDLYQVLMFKMVRCCGGGAAMPREWFYVPACDLGFFLFSISPDGGECRIMKQMPNLAAAQGEGAALKAVQASSVLHMSVLHSEYVAQYDHVAVPWLPFMAFALLHCKNVATETVVAGEREQRRVKKSGNPPRCSYKVLRLDVPGTTQRREDRCGELVGNKVRFHLCRGHFKNLQHQRFKAKGWHWWPAHWRGDRKLGVVEKSYELRGKDSEPERSTP